MMLDETLPQDTAAILVPESLRSAETSHSPHASHDLSCSRRFVK
jgi:hypothetical protein